ncbi:NAD(P)-binding protein [Rickenella mellea]|uniref:NAD(P)-binding protein n=1 Tax=Rickenella mellea TaxID=50990 RepID=A0A4Y7Q6U7_9AGAM|nr:NAD(P)-binding protein [Rickenella mellea]
MANPSTQFVWLITGTSSGFGRDLAVAALKRGDKVIATARGRSLGKLGDLKAQGADVLELDVTAPFGKIQEVAKNANAIHGKIDVLVNNAGYILVGAMEENTPEETLQQFHTNVFGGLNIARAVLPYMRARKTGTVVWYGSLGGWRAVPNAGLYCATKYALRGIGETLHAEISPLGLRSLVIEPGYFRTEFLAADNRAPQVSRIADYKPMTEKANEALLAYNGKQPGDPKKGVEVIIDVIKQEGLAKGKEPPVVLPLGSDCLAVVQNSCQNTLKTLEEWKDVIVSTDFPK